MNKIIPCFLGAIFLLANVKAASELPQIGGSSSRTLSIIEEQLVGDDYMRQLRALAPILNDAEVNDYIQHLGFKLVENNPDAENRHFLFFVIEQNSINAFAMPGGYIGLHTDLITTTETESELAAVLGHEIAHVTQRHLARRLELQNQLALPSLAAFAAAILVASRSSSTENTIGAIMGAQGLAQQAMINHTRSNEAEADRIGIATLYNAGFDPAGAITFFEKMQTNQRYSSNAFEFLRTHPLSRSRITDVRLRASEFPKKRVIQNASYPLIKEKIKALTSQITPAILAQMKSRYQSGEFATDAQKYGYALLLARAKQFDEAEEILKKLAQNDKLQSSYQIAIAELNIERNTAEQSIALIKTMLVQAPSNLALIEIMGKLLIAQSEFKQARTLLLENIHILEKVPYLLKLLSKAQDGAGFQSEVFETEGKYLLAMGDLHGARIQFEQALTYQTKDPYARSRINAQINDIKAFIRQRSLRR